MKNRTSLRRQMLGMMALLVIVQSIGLLFALGISQVFVRLDAEAFRLFNSATATRAQKYNGSIGLLVASMAEETTALNDRLLALEGELGIPGGQFFQKAHAYDRAARLGVDAVLSLLEKNVVSGAFCVLNGSNANRNDPAAHSAVYVRNDSPSRSTVGKSYQLEVGPIAVSQEYQIAASINWDLDMEILDDRFYKAPIRATADWPGAEIERYGFWGVPSDVLRDGNRVATYTMPLMDANGVAYGVLGVEISPALFGQHYLPNAELPYPNSFFAIAPSAENTLDLRWFIPSGPLPEVYLPRGGSLRLKPVECEAQLFETELPGMDAVYCSAQPLVMYSRNSPFYGESWTLLGFVPKLRLHETSSQVRAMLITGIAIITLASLGASFLVTVITTRKISGLSKYIQGLSPTLDIRFARTGIREIDDLTSALERLNTRVANAAKTTSKILELSLLPIGGYEVVGESNRVVLTEYVAALLGLEQETWIPLDSWEQHRRALMAHPNEEVENVYRVTAADGGEKWMRILETHTDTGKVGVLLDVTRDIEDRRRLALQLDFDALTQLYSRSAFKREAESMILRQPNKKGALIFADLDNLKYFNDNFGHDMGDRLIIRAGEMFRQFEGVGGIVSRFSGDEFSIYLHGYDSLSDLKQVIYQQYRKHESFHLDTPNGASHEIRSSSGIAFYPRDSENVTHLLKLADFAMYEAKNSQKGSVFEFNEESYKRNAYLLENREAINHMLDEELIRFAFQPIVSLRTGTVFAYEALMRPLLDNFKTAREILTVAAAQSKLSQLERLVMLKAFETVKTLLPRLGGAKVFVNSVPNQVLSEKDNAHLLGNYGDVFRHIVLEITEAENAAPYALQSKLNFAKRSGMQVAVDDYGSGYSNEARVLALNPNIVKVDIGMISHIDESADKQTLVSNLISFCRPKGIRVAAEGVERGEELAALTRLGIDYVQGHYIGRPDFELTPVSEKVRKEILYLNDNL